MRKAMMLLSAVLLIGCQSTQGLDPSGNALAKGASCEKSSRQFVMEIAPGVVVINGVTVTPGLSKELLLAELGEPCRLVKGTPGTHQSDGFLYDKSFGFRFHTRPGEQQVTEMSFWRQQTNWNNVFEGTLVVLGKRLPLDYVQNVKRVLPELGLEYDRNLDAKTARTFGFYEANIGNWQFGIRAEAQSGAITSLSLTFQSIFCADKQQTDCFERATGRWRSP